MARPYLGENADPLELNRYTLELAGRSPDDPAWGSLGRGANFGAQGASGADSEFVTINGVPHVRLGDAQDGFARAGLPVIFDPTYGYVSPDVQGYARQQDLQRQHNASEGGIEGFLNNGGGVGLAAGMFGPMAIASQLGGLSGVASSFGAPAGTTGAELAASAGANSAAGAVGGFGDAPWGVGQRAAEGGAMDMGVGLSTQGGTFGFSGPGLATGGTGLPSGLSNIASAVKRAFTGDGSGSDYATTLGVVGGGAALASGLSGSFGGGTTQTSSTNVPGMSAEERELIALNAELTRRQLSAIDQLQPFQRQMLEMALAEMQRQQAEDSAVSGAVSPEERAALARDEFQRAQRMGPMQDEVMQIQLDALRRNGAATPEQEALIKRATDSSIESAGYDIDAATARGIGLISDEIANSRGLRLTDSPMSSEAALLAREGVIQKGGIEKSLRANEANAKLNYPLAVSQLSSQMSALPAQIATSARDFQETLRQRAFANRMAVTGNATSTGLGLSSVGGGNAALSALTNNRLASASTTTNVNRGIGLSDVGNVASGVGNLIYGASRLWG
jgi:hypothetical protein